MDADPPEEPELVAPRPRRLLRALLFVGSFLVVLTVAGVVAFPRIVRATLDRELARRGLHLDGGRIDVSLARVTIDDASLVSNEGVRVRIGHLEVEHRFGTPQRAHVHALRVDGERGALVALEQRIADVPSTVDDGEIALRALEGGLPDDASANVRFATAERQGSAFVLTGLAFVLDLPGAGEQLSLEAPTASVDPGPAAGPGGLVLEVPRRPAEGAPHEVVKVAARGRGTAEIRDLVYDEAADRLTFSVVGLEELLVEAHPSKKQVDLRVESLTKERAARFGVSLPGGAAGTASIGLEDPAQRRARVSFDVSLQGFVPPHPRELNGILFGDRTKVRGRALLTLQGSRPRGTLDDLVVEAGALTLKGEGTLNEDGVAVTLRGSVGCAELATSAVSAHLGFSVGMGTSALSRQLLGGTVGVTVKIEAAFAELDHPTIVPNAVVRCSVRLGL